MHSTQVFYVRSVNKLHTKYNCFSLHCNHELKLFPCVSQEFVLHTNCPDIDFEEGGGGGLINTCLQGMYAV